MPLSGAIPLLAATAALLAPQADAAVSVSFSNSTGVGFTSATVNAPAGASYTAAAPWGDTSDVWNVVGRQSTTATTATPGTYTLYSSLGLLDMDGGASGVALTIDYTNTRDPINRNEPGGASGDNTIQPGGVMAMAWRNYWDGSGNYLTFSLAGLAANQTYEFYFYGGTTGAGQSLAIKDTSFNLLASTDNSTLGSIWASDGGGGYILTAEGSTWDKAILTSDGSGTIQFVLERNGPYFNGFQFNAVPEPSSVAIAGLGLMSLAFRRRRV